MKEEKKADLSDVLERQNEEQKKILEETYNEILEKLNCTVSTGKDTGISSVPMNKMEKFVGKIVKNGFNNVSCRNGLGPIVD